MKKLYLDPPGLKFLMSLVREKLEEKDQYIAELETKVEQLEEHAILDSSTQE